MKADYLIAFFAIAGTGLGNPLVPSDLALRAESSDDEALVKELCLNMPAAASEEQKRACDGALEHAKRRLNFHTCRKPQKGAPRGKNPFCSLPHRRQADEAEEEASAGHDGSLAEKDMSSQDSDLSRRFPQDEVEGGDVDESKDSADATGALPKRDEEASKLSRILLPSIKAKCAKLPAHAPPQLRALCNKIKAKGQGKRGTVASSGNNTEDWEKRSEQAMTDDGEKSEGLDDEGLEKRSFRNPAILGALKAKCSKLPTNAPAQLKALCKKYKAKGLGKRAVEDAATEQGWPAFCKEHANGIKMPGLFRAMCGPTHRS